MIQDRLPDKAVPVRGSFKSLSAQGLGFTVHQALATRPDSGEQIPTIGLIPPDWNRTLVVWVHPKGKAGLFEPGSDRPIPAVRKLLDRKIAVMAPDLFLTGEFHLPDQPTQLAPVNNQQNYAGYRHGYNRTVLANRVHDLLTILAFARNAEPRTVHLIAEGKMGPAALLARAMSGDQVSRAVIDVDGFDFDQVKDPLDEMMLPGALKYGGILGFTPLCTSGETVLCNAPKSPAASRVKLGNGVTLHEKQAHTDDLVELLLR
jgi:hypothetical protein